MALPEAAGARCPGLGRNGPRSLAIEVISPSNTADEVEDKKRDYFRAGVRQVWVVYSRQGVVHICTSTTQVQILTGEQELDGGDLLPGFRLPLATLFAEEPPAD